MIARPLLLDLFCGAGGASVGYHRAGFDVLGVDINPQPHYPFMFLQTDALSLLTELVEDERIVVYYDDEIFPVDAIHASPVCKLWSSATPAAARANHVDYITPARPLLNTTGLPWVMENVPGAPLRADFKICGCQVGLPELERERWFETNWYRDLDLRQSCSHVVQPVTVAGHGEPSGPRLKRAAVISVVGGGADKGKPNRNYGVADWRRAMGIDWMTRDELAQAVPPAYTEYIGRQLLAALEGAA